MGDPDRGKPEMSIDDRIEALMRGWELYVAEQAAMDRKFEERYAKLTEQHAATEREIDRVARLQAWTERRLTRAIQLSVLDARRQRKRYGEFDKRNAEIDKRQAEFDAAMKRLEAAQERTEASLRAFIESLKSGNGHK